MIMKKGKHFLYTLFFSVDAWFNFPKRPLLFLKYIYQLFYYTSFVTRNFIHESFRQVDIVILTLHFGSNFTAI